MKQRLFTVVGLVILTGLGSASAQPLRTIREGTWRATLQTKGGELPFGLEITSTINGKTFTVYALNGSERLLFDKASFLGDSLRIPMTIFESEIIAKVGGDTMRGIWRKRRTGQNYSIIPFEARYGLLSRFTPSTKKPTEGRSISLNVTGTWATTFRSEGDSTLAVGLFNQQGNRLTGTFLTTTGDYRYLEGNIVGDSLFLSCFDGMHAYLFKAAIKPTKRLEGGFWSGSTGYKTWTAHLDPKAALPNPTKLTYLKPGYQSIAFSFPDPTGNLVSMNDERFKNKVVVVQLLGSWCPNCMDETNFLSPWYKKNRQRGVEIVGLAYEKSANLKESAPKLLHMQDRFKIDYPILLAGTNGKGEASKTLPMLNHVIGFPTTIIIDKKGTVREIHTGFSGPSTGTYYDNFIEDFNKLIDKLLLE